MATYTCTQCGRARSIAQPVFSAFYAIAVLVATIPITIVMMRKPWDYPWYWVFPIIAGEILAVFMAGMLCSFAYVFVRIGTNWCRHCGGKTFFAGRHFDPAGSRDPHTADVILFAVFLALNAILWLAIARAT